VTRLRVLLAAAAALALAACAASGPPFEPVEPPAGKALVYIYRPELGYGPLVRFHVAVGGKYLVWLIRGGYFPYLAAPGETEFTAGTEGEASVTENLRAGHTYYLLARATEGYWVPRPRLEFVPEEEAEEELESCVLLPPSAD
jgi:hypothetical protein